MGHYLGECFLAASASNTLAPSALDAAFAPSGVRVLQTIFVPDDEVCLYLFESDSLERVRQASAAAGISIDRLHPVEPTLHDATPADLLELAKQAGTEPERR